jgi:putative ABC transport system substrate-binding protein
MRRREFIALLGGTAATIAWRQAALAQPSRKVLRIGMLETIPQAFNAALLDAFQRGMQERGYLQGKHYVIEYRSADGHVERFPELAAELVRLKVDIIVSRGTPAALAASGATKTIPIVMAAAGDPPKIGAVADIARPGGNVTGLSSFTTVLQTKKVEILRDAMPSVRRIAALLTMSNPIALPQWSEIKSTAQALGMQAQLYDLRNSADIESAFRTAAADGVEAFVVGLGSLIQANRQSVVDQANKHRLPAIFQSREFVEAGGLMSYGVSYTDLYFRAADYIDKIAKGARPGDLAIEQPSRFELVVNLKTAKAIGLNMPDSFLVRADEVIE